jgi:hypothetical protein
MARTKNIGIEMSGGTFANYSPGMMVIGSSRGRGDLVTLNEADIDGLLAMLADRPAMRHKASLAPKLKWIKHEAWEKVYQAELPTGTGTYVIEPIWDFDKHRVISGYSIVFVPLGLAETDKLMEDGTKASDLKDSVNLGRGFISLGRYVGRADQGEEKFIDAKKVAQDHFQGLHDQSREAA